MRGRFRSTISTISTIGTISTISTISTSKKSTITIEDYQQCSEGHKANIRRLSAVFFTIYQMENKRQNITLLVSKN